ncbi:DUF998 domain-containing protein [Haloarcula salinisoli]|uniref:DUF998 domain-containing protein n=1 Tax=Haloarcula salinisoli TaxID=2487746 RepID=A0A8J7YHU6_9EURY|nr:DUF998 domain-containing protein [Halomicroarcula salinisoli]MBX0302974.1 DUF998 domain-containing protein [Halomicroarcula salinisoli]
MDELTRAGRLAGVAAVCIAAIGIAGAALASPTFAVTGNALSDLGQPGDPVATPVTTLLFDGGLVLAGVVGLPFAVVLWRRSETRLGQAAVVPFSVALLGMVGVGLFPAGRPLHLPAALTLYLASMVAMAVDGAGTALAGGRRRAAVTSSLVAVHVAGWWWWAASGPVLRPGLAIPELLGAGVFAAWVVLIASDRRGPA